MRLTGVLILFGCTVGGLSQTVPRQTALPLVDTSTRAQYEALFREYALPPPASPENAAPKPVAPIGLPEDGLAKLREIAIDWEAKERAIRSASGQLVFESRLRFIQTGEGTEGLEERLKALDDRHSQNTWNHAEQLRKALGGRFEIVEAYMWAKLTAPKPMVIEVRPQRK